MWWGHHGFFPFGGFLFVALLLLVLRFVFFRRCGRWGRGHYGGEDEAEAIVRRRFASGEINEEEYQRLKKALGR